MAVVHSLVASRGRARAQEKMYGCARVSQEWDRGGRLWDRQEGVQWQGCSRGAVDLLLPSIGLGVCLRARGLADVTGTRGNTDSPTGGEEEEEETEGGMDVEYVCCVCDKSVLCIIYTMRKQ